MGHLVQVIRLESMPAVALSEVTVDVSLQEALDQILRLPSIASKRYLTNKGDRSVTGLVAQSATMSWPSVHAGCRSCSYRALLLEYRWSCGGT